MATSSNCPLKSSFFAASTVSVIYTFGDNHVIKRRPLSDEDSFEYQAYNIEICAYKRLGFHERIAHCEVTDAGLILERGECLRQRLRTTDIPISTKLQWAQEAAEGLSYIHQKNIIHADVGCHNMILDKTDHVKFIDFAGSGIDGETPLVCYEVWSYRPSNEISISTDIFAFGSMLFELESGKVPYHELEGTMSMGILATTVENLFTRKEFPNVKMLVLGPIIDDCWNGRYGSMDEVCSHITKISHTLCPE